MRWNSFLLLFYLGCLPGGVILGQQSDQSLEINSPDSIFSIENDSINHFTPKFQTHSFDQLLQGNFTGVHAVQASGQPGAQLMIQVRGLRSLAGGNEPLYIIDGFPLYNDNAQANSGLTLGPTMNALSFWNPEDVASIQVLKDGLGTALYGARGANGVIIINTRRGQVGKPTLELEIQFGNASSLMGPTLLDGANYADYINRAYAASDRTAPHASPATFGTGSNWMDLIQRESPLLQTYRLGVSGGTGNMAFRLQGSYSRQEGNISGSDLNRFTLQANIDAQASKRIHVSNSLNVARIDANTIATDDSGIASELGAITAAQTFSPLLASSIDDAQASFFNFLVDDSGVTPQLQSQEAYTNPVALVSAIDSRLVATRFTDYFRMNVDLFDGLSLSGGLGVDAIFNEESLFVPGALEYNTTPGGTGGGARMQSVDWVSDIRLNYQKNINDRHLLEGMIGYSLQGYRREILGGISRGFENQTLRFNDLGVGSSKFIQSDRSESRWRSAFAMFNYSLDNRYEISFVLRSDGSAKNGGAPMIFPAVGLHWHILKNQETISQVSARFGIGQSGSLAIPPYQQFTIIGEVPAALNGSVVNGLNRIRLGTENLEFEKTTKINFGLDLGVFENSLLVKLEYYSDVTNNALAFVPLAGQSGFGFSLENIAEVQNSGFEASIATKNFGQRIQWSAQLNLSANTNEIRDLGEGDEILVGDEILGIDDWSILRVGESIGSFYGFESEVSNGVISYRDLNGDGVLSGADRKIIGRSAPKLVFGLSNTLSFRGLEFNFLLQGTSGNDIANFNELMIGNPNGQSNIRQGVVAERSPDASQTLRFSDILIEDGSYLRLRRLQLGYHLPESLTGKFGAIKIYTSLENIWTATGYSGVDPDVSHFGQQHVLQGVDFGGYPKARQILGGIQIRF